MTAPSPPASATPSEFGHRRTGRVDTVEGERAVRFDGAERLLHAITASLVLVQVVTGSVMYLSFLSGALGGRAGVEMVHLWCGLALPVPFALVTIGPWGRGFRRDLRRLGRFLPDDWRWLQHRRGQRPASIRVGKFNAGQKVNAILVGGALPVMFATGLMLEWNRSLSDGLRTGATFVHDWGYVCLTLLIAGHIAKALASPTALRAVLHGRVPLRWARDHHPRWHAEVLGIEDRIVPPTESHHAVRRGTE